MRMRETFKFLKRLTVVKDSRSKRRTVYLGPDHLSVCLIAYHGAYVTRRFPVIRHISIVFETIRESLCHSRVRSSARHHLRPCEPVRIYMEHVKVFCCELRHKRLARARSACYSDCYPDYNLIADELQKEYERQNA